MTTGRFKAKTQAMKDAMSTFTEAAGAEFNAAVATALRGRGFTARAQVKKFGPKKMLGSNGQDLGDIDVLAVDPGTWSLYVVECKNMSPDRMPHEAKSDLDALFLGTPRAASTQEKHLRRVAWVRANLKHVLDAWQLEQREWSVQPLLVLSHPLHAPLLGHAKMKVLSMAELSSGASLC
jgi:hypothetical protein